MSFLDSWVNQSALNFCVTEIELQDLYRLNQKQVGDFLFDCSKTRPDSVTIDFDPKIEPIDQWVGLQRFYILFEALDALKTVIIKKSIPINVIQDYFNFASLHRLTTLEFNISFSKPDEKNDPLFHQYIQCIIRYFNQNTVLQNLTINWENLTEKQQASMSILHHEIKQHPNLISYTPNLRILDVDFESYLKEKAEKITEENETIRSLFKKLTQSNDAALGAIPWLESTYATTFNNRKLLLPNKRHSNETLTQVEGMAALGLFLSTTLKSNHQGLHYLKRLKTGLHSLNNDSNLCQKTIQTQSINDLNQYLKTLEEIITQFRSKFTEKKDKIDFNDLDEFSNKVRSLSDFSQYDLLLSFKYSKIIHAVDYYAQLATKAIDAIYKDDSQAMEIKSLIIELQKDPGNIELQNNIKNSASMIENRSASRHARYLAKTLFTIAALSALIGALSLLAIGLSVFTAGGSLALAAPCIAGVTLALSPLLTGAGVVFQRQGMKIPNRLRSLERAAQKISDHAFFKTKDVTMPHQSSESPSQKR